VTTFCPIYRQNSATKFYKSWLAFCVSDILYVHLGFLRFELSTFHVKHTIFKKPRKRDRSSAAAAYIPLRVMLLAQYFLQSTINAKQA
jgi:hypothetical protein